MAKAKNLKGKMVTVQVIKSEPRKSRYSVKYRVTDGRGKTRIVEGDEAEAIDRRPSNTVKVR